MAVATIEWAGAGAVIRDVCRRADDDAIVSVIDRACKSGIDCPFGWPDAFVDFVAADHSGHASLPRSQTGAGLRQESTMRRTDAFVHDKLRITPLSVSADKIAHVALRCAVLLARLDAAGHPVDRSGAGPVVEVYPAASLRSWGLYGPGYKQAAKPDVLGRLVDDLRAGLSRLDCGAGGATAPVGDRAVRRVRARAVRLGAPHAAHQPAVPGPAGGPDAGTRGRGAAPGAGEGALQPGGDRRLSRSG